MKPIRDSYSNGRLTARPSAPTPGKEVYPGIHPLGLDSVKDGLLYVPKGYHASKPAALAVMLHGSGGNPEQGMWLLQKYADTHNLILIAPPSRKYTWDVIVSDSFGPDAIYMDQALKQVFENYAINPGKIAIGGFSDGASYALCMALTNGDLFTHVIAFSPGFAFTREKHGLPAAFLSHGVHDGVLPIDPCGRSVNRELKRQGLQVNYLEFDGEHEIPANVSLAAIEWFLK
ncbi:alpha/beta hydrolase [Rufibacter latericius]|uniref:Phospholipase n=1 Tax=Rufibacter latericius TaxID=2487040 RepID=A0A3M9MUL0_9BACT|nr:alpha/beta hydrolase-fold protein [Rufibacter latericius]RNI29200.1 phospholipase [Rufibacter latericius]